MAERAAAGLSQAPDGTVRDDAHGWSMKPWRAGGGTRAVLRWDVHVDPFLALLSLSSLEGQLGAIESQLVAELRAFEFSWADIGQALGITGEAVRKMYGQPPAG